MADAMMIGLTATTIRAAVQAAKALEKARAAAKQNAMAGRP
jgi:hypothetical protein